MNDERKHVFFIASKLKWNQTNVSNSNQTINKALAIIFVVDARFLRVVLKRQTFQITNLDTIHRYQKEKKKKQNETKNRNKIRKKKNIQEEKMLSREKHRLERMRKK